MAAFHAAAAAAQATIAAITAAKTAPQNSKPAPPDPTPASAVPHVAQPPPALKPAPRTPPTGPATTVPATGPTTVPATGPATAPATAPPLRAGRVSDPGTDVAEKAETITRPVTAPETVIGPVTGNDGPVKDTRSVTASVDARRKAVPGTADEADGEPGDGKAPEARGDGPAGDGSVQDGEGADEVAEDVAVQNGGSTENMEAENAADRGGEPAEDVVAEDTGPAEDEGVQDGDPAEDVAEGDGSAKDAVAQDDGPAGTMVAEDAGSAGDGGVRDGDHAGKVRADGPVKDGTGEGAQQPAAGKGTGPDAEEGKARTGRVLDTPLPDSAAEALTTALAAVRAGVTDLRFGLDLPGAEEARRVQGEILAQLDDYVVPRVRTSASPALIAIAGSTGAGKSTLVNSLAKSGVSATGVRRPTTGTPILVCHPDDHEWFAEGDLLGGLRRLGEPTPGTTGGIVLVSAEDIPPGVALLDTPDIDSVVEEHHETAHRMLDAADLWIFVTTAARYADAPAWRLLRLAKERGARLAIVLSRVPPRSREVVTKHFVRMLTEYGLGEVDRFVINEGKVTDGMLPDDEVAELRRWLTELSVDERRREQAVRATLDGVLNSFRTRVPALAKHMEMQVAFRRELRGDVDGAYARALAGIERNTGDGSLLRGEVLARWQDFAGSGDLMRALHLRKPGRLGAKAVRQTPERLTALKAALRAGLESVVVSAAQRAAEEAAARWLQRPGAEELLSAVPGLGHASDEIARRTGRTVAAWQDHITELIRTEGVTKRSVARVISFDAESLSLILTIGLLGNDSTPVEGTAGTLPGRLVHALLGAESLRNIGGKARSDLRARIGLLFDEEIMRYVQALDSAGIPDETAATRLYQATYNLEVAR